MTQVNLKMEVNQRLSEPYEKCTKKKFLDDYYEQQTTFGDVFTKLKYSRGSAVLRCQQLETIRECGCVHPYLPITPEIFERMATESLVTCFTLPGYNFNFAGSLDDTLNNIECFDRISFKDKCKGFENPCEERVYNFNQYQTAWPHESYELAVYQNQIELVDEVRRDKFGNRFRVYDDIFFESTLNNTRALERLRTTDLIERNFIQLKVQFQVIHKIHKNGEND